MPDLYISVDIESDGPIPGQYSMLSFGLAVASSFDGQKLIVRDPAADAFYRELKPIGELVDAQALAVSRLDRKRLLRQGMEPKQAMLEAARWIAVQAGGACPVLVGYPVVFDWMFLHWYFVRFLGQSPFGFSSALDMKTIYQTKAKVILNKAGREDLPAEFSSGRAHSHNALDDAIEQAEIFNRLFTWKETSSE